MVKMYKEIVSSCQGCPNSSINYDNNSSAERFLCTLNGKFVEDLTTIPDWCTLEGL